MSSSDSNKLSTELPTDLQNTSIPLLMCDNVKSDRNWYSVRLTPDNDNDFLRGDIIELIEAISVGDWMICTEFSSKKKIHYHLVLYSVFSAEDVKKDFTEFLREKYPDKWKKEDGNKRCNFAPTKDLPQYIKYMCKDKDYKIGSNINPKYIEWASTKAFKKYSKEAFAVALQALKNDYQDDKLTIRQLRTGIIRLKGEYGQPINISRVNDMVLGIQIKKHPDMADDL